MKFSFSRIFAIFSRQWFLIKSNPARLSFIFLPVVIDILQWGFISKYLETFGQATFNFISVILGAIIFWEFTIRIHHGIMAAFLEDIWSLNFINLFATPLKIGEYLAGLILTSISTGITGFLTMTILAGLFFGYNFFKIGFLILPLLFILFLSGIAIGIFISGIIFLFGPSAEWLGWPIPMVISIFSGVFYPIATLPAPLRLFSKIIPASYVFETARLILSTKIFQTQIFQNIILGFLLSFLYFLISGKFFLRIYQHNLKSGALARFSAETF